MFNRRAKSRLSIDQDQENVQTSVKVSSLGDHISKTQRNSQKSVSSRAILGAKSSNALQPNVEVGAKGGMVDTVTNLNAENVQSNKARKVVRGPQNSRSGLKRANTFNTVLLKEQSQKPLLARTSSNSTLLNPTITRNARPLSRINSQLTTGAKNDFSDFFKKSKEQVNNKLGLSLERSHTSLGLPSSELNREIGNFEKTIDIGLHLSPEKQNNVFMKKLTSNRGSPNVRRSRKKERLNFSSSLSDGDYDDLEHTFDKGQQHKGYNDMAQKMGLTLNSDISVTLDQDADLDLGVKGLDKILDGVTDDEDQFEIETTSKPDVNAKYYLAEDELEVPTGHIPMSADLISSIWKPNQKFDTKIQSFEDPLSLDLTKLKNHKPNVLEVSKAEVGLENSDLELEFSDGENEEERLQNIIKFYEIKK